MAVDLLGRTGKSRVLAAVSVLALLVAGFLGGVFVVSSGDDELLIEREQLVNELGDWGYLDDISEGLI